jgi:hypothetical protein
MPSTYTLNNGIELIGTGEQSGTWGDTTNTNLGLLDVALDGQVTVALASAGSSGSPNSLPITDGTASNGRNRMVVFSDSGDLGATAYVQLTPNDAEKIIYIRNSLSGSRSVILFQGTYNASNDYEVPAGTTAVVYFDGAGAGAVAANVFNNAYFDGLRLGSVSVTAILDEDNMASDSATALATQQSIKAYVDSQVGTVDTLAEILAIGNTTGGTDIVASTTDKVQFRDAAIYINSSVDGQLDIVADTEIQIAATTVDVNGALDVSGTALVTGVLTTTAATVSNGGGQFNGAINVGVDDTGYDVKFFGATTGKSLLWDESADSLIVTGTTTLVGTTNLDAVDIDGATQIDATVTVGVDDTGYDVKFFGATAGAYMLWDESADTLEVSGTVTADGLTVDGSAVINQYLTLKTTDDQVNGWLLYTGTTDKLEFNYNGSGNAEVVIDSTGNVGIGTTSPSHLIDGRLSGTSSGEVISVGNATGGSFGGIAISDGGTYPVRHWGSSLEFYTGNSTYSSSSKRMTIDSSGGLITNPAAGGHAVFNEAGVDADFRVESDGNANMLFVDGGNNAVGIGTAAPESIVHIKDSGNVTTTLQIESAANQYAPVINFDGLVGASADYILGEINGSWDTHTNVVSSIRFESGADTTNKDDGLISFWTSSSGPTLAERMRIESSGGLITNPAAGGHAVFNEGGVDADFRVESDGNANALFVQASDGKVGIGTSSPETNNAASVGLTVGSSGSGAAIQLNVNGGGGIFSGTDTINNPNYSYRMGHLNGTNRLEMSTNNSNSYANGVVLSAGGTSWGTFSDERRKTDLVEITDGLNKVSTLRAVTGRYNYDDANVRRSMLIAQDVQAVLPEAVGAMTASMEDPTEYLTLNYTETIPLLVSALKDAKQLIEALTARITALENA